MKLTKSKLRRIIKEELQRILLEQKIIKDECGRPLLIGEKDSPQYQTAKKWLMSKPDVMKWGYYAPGNEISNAAGKPKGCWFHESDQSKCAKC